MVGDVIRVEAGMNITVDGILLKGDDVQTNESSITGEGGRQRKEDINQCILERSQIE